MSDEQERDAVQRPDEGLTALRVGLASITGLHPQYKGLCDQLFASLEDLYDSRRINRRLTAERDAAIKRAAEAEEWNAVRDSAAAKERNKLMHVLFERDVDPAERMHLVWSLKTKLDWLNKTLTRLDLAGVWTGADDLLDDRVAQVISERDAARAELAKLKETVRQETLNLESLANWFDLDSDYRSRLERLRDAVTAIRSALGSEIN